MNLARKIADAAFTITVSDYNLAHLREQYPAEAPVYRIYNGLDLEQFPYHAPENRPPHLLAVGRLVEKKGFPDLIDAIAALRERGINCTCDIIGDGNQRETLAAHIARLHLEDRVRLLGNRSQAEVKNHIRQAAMLIAPSIISADGDRDGLPTILVEAMALGTPCISTNIVGIPELVRDGDTGLLAPPNRTHRPPAQRPGTRRPPRRKCPRPHRTRLQHPRQHRPTTRTHRKKHRGAKIKYRPLRQPAPSLAGRVASAAGEGRGGGGGENLRSDNLPNIHTPHPLPRM